MTRNIFNTIEEIKLAYISHTPIAWLVTPNKEVADEIVVSFVEEHMGCFKGEFGDSVNLKELSSKGGINPFVYYQWFAPLSSENFNNSSKYFDLQTRLEYFINCFYQFQSELDGRSTSDGSYNRSIAIIASNHVPSFEWLNSYIRTIYIDPLSDEDICQTLNDFSISTGLTLDKKFINDLIVNFRGFSNRQIIQVLDRCVALEYFETNNNESIISEIRALKHQMLDGFNGLKWEESNDERAAGLGAVSSWLHKRESIFSDPKRSLKKGYDIPKGFLVTGIPGTGKSLMAKETARILKLPLISMDLGDIQEGIVGKSEEHMASALRLVDAMAPCVLWIDEIEKAFSGANSSQGDSGVMRRMFGKFLTWMQEKKSFCFVVATSNDITNLPPELFRSERFDEKFYTFMPSAQECAEIFVACIKSANLKYAKYNGKNARLFDSIFETETYWINWLNSINSKEVQMTESNGYGYWKNAHTPSLKLFTGADISAFVKLLKFEILSERDNPSSKFHNASGIITNIEMTAVINNVLNTFMPYGQTNVKNIADSFFLLSKNRLQSSSGAPEDEQIILFSDFNEDKKQMLYYSNKFSAEPYNQALYRCILGAINQRYKQPKEIAK